MLSRISIDMDWETNQPIIKIQYRQSEDVRDAMVKAFLDNCGVGDKMPSLQWNGNGDGFANVNVILQEPEQALAWANVMVERKAEHAK